MRVSILHYLELRLSQIKTGFPLAKFCFKYFKEEDQRRRRTNNKKKPLIGSGRLNSTRSPLIPDKPDYTSKIPQLKLYIEQC